MASLKSAKSTRGFTLIELVIVIAVVSIFGALTADILANAVNIYSSALKRQKFISEARSTFFKINREASWQKNFSSFSGSTNKKLNIYSGDGKSINYEIRSTNDIIQNNSQVPGSNNEVLADNINYSNSTIYYLNQQGNGIDITSQSDDIKSLMFDFQFSSDGETIRMQGQTLPYNLRIGRALSYHE